MAGLYGSPAPRAIGALAGFPASLKPSSGMVWTILAAMVRVQADSAAGSRRVGFEVRSGSSFFYKVVAGADQAADETVEYLLGPGHPFETSVSSHGTLMLPFAGGIVIDDSMEFRVVNEGAAGAGDLVAPRLMVLERSALFVGR